MKTPEPGERAMGISAYARRTLSVLLVEDNAADARFVRLAMALVSGVSIDLTETARLDDALAALESRPFDVVLLDLGLPDSVGLSTFSVLHARFRLAPVVVLSALADDATMFDAVRLGAQDYLIKGEFDAALLVRVMRHAIERQRLVIQLERSLAYVRSLHERIEQAALSEEGSAGFAMCAWCKRLRDTSGRWEPIEDFLASREDSPLKHETCPDCIAKIRSETPDEPLG